MEFKFKALSVMIYAGNTSVMKGLLVELSLDGLLALLFIVDFFDAFVDVSVHIIDFRLVYYVREIAGNCANAFSRKNVKKRKMRPNSEKKEEIQGAFGKKSPVKKRKMRPNSENAEEIQGAFGKKSPVKKRKNEKVKR